MHRAGGNPEWLKDKKKKKENHQGARGYFHANSSVAVQRFRNERAQQAWREVMVTARSHLLQVRHCLLLLRRARQQVCDHRGKGHPTSHPVRGLWILGQLQAYFLP